MQIKNNIIRITIFVLNLFVFSTTTYAEELNISAKDITIKKETKTVIARGSVKIVDDIGNIILSDNAIYEKS